ncbi:MAG: hypothetical protein KAG34_08160 [Cocleimonas sp.]|nr:hypothetical protein [Cocleimonas sp.]
MVDNKFSVADLISASVAAGKGKETTLEKPNPVDVGDFSKAMSKGSKSEAHCAHKCPEGTDKTGAKGSDKSSAAEGSDKAGGAEGNDKSSSTKGAAEGSNKAGGAEGNDKSSSTKGADKVASTEGVDEAGGTEGADKAGSADGDQMKKILMMLMELLTMLTKMMKEDSEGGDSDGSSSKGADAVGAGSGSTPSAGKGASSGSGAGKGAGSGSAAGKGEGASKGADAGHGASKGGSEKAAKVENGNIVAENNVAAGNGEIPKPTEHKQSFELGGKQVTIGGDGSASAAEVQQTKETLTDLYNNSDTFKEMVDSSPNEKFEVSVGKRDDNMSWGNEDGRVFMNINNITPDSNDAFQSLMAHEMGHAGADMQHGAEMKQFEQAVAKEA